MERPKVEQDQATPIGKRGATIGGAVIAVAGREALPRDNPLLVELARMRAEGTSQPQGQ